MERLNRGAALMLGVTARAIFAILALGLSFAARAQPVPLGMMQAGVSAPVNGACGTANGTPVSSAPTTNLCSAGSASAVTGSGPWNWSCAGSNGGTTASCSAPTTAGANSASVLFGYYNSGSTTKYCSALGRCPDYSINYSFTLPGSSGSNPCTDPNQYEGAYPQLVSFPMLGATGGGSQYNDVTQIVPGNYDSAYLSTLNNQIIPCANRIYAIRVNSEWYLCNGNSYYEVYYNFSSSSCSYPSEVIDHATWIAATQHFITLIRNTLASNGITNIKIEWDIPKASNMWSYDIGTSYYDVAGIDYYFFPGNLGNDPTQAWNNALGSSTTDNSLAYVYAQAQAKGKQLMFPESCVAYNTDTDPGGTFFNNLWPWAIAHLVGFTYWDSEQAGTGCSFSNSAPKTATFKTQLGGLQPYSGSFWGTPYPTPVPNPFQ